jgi:hypothetical protein
MAQRLVLNLLTSYSLQSKDHARELFRLWTELLPEYAPERFGNYEPIRIRFNADDIESALEHWEWPFLVKRQKPRMQGSIFIGGGKVPVHGWITVDFDFKPAHQKQFIEFFKVLSVKLNAEFGFLHIKPKDKHLIVTTHVLRNYIPAMFWTTLLGKAYVDMFGHERIRGCGAPINEELGADMFYLQASEEFLDLERKGEEVARTLNQIKKHLNNNAFFDPELGSDHVYSVPRFNIDTN